MEMDLTLWGGLRPLLGHRGDKEEECGGKQGMKKKDIFFIYTKHRIKTCVVNPGL